ncbi:MAG: hypothetical protein AABY00_01725 [Nanoarchaeota archaeon]
MDIEEATIGGWFQRTTLHLTEVYDFLSTGKSESGLDKVKLNLLRTNLHILNVERKNGLLEYIEVSTHEGISFRLYEDGLIILRKNVQHGLELALTDLRNYYDEKLSAAFSFLFSRGAPVPKELAHIDTILPFILIARSVGKDDVADFFKKRGLRSYATLESAQATVYKSDRIILVVSRTNLEKSRHLVEAQIFFREFKSQLHTYLRIHRRVWDEIACIKEKGVIKGVEIKKMRAQLDAYQKTIKLIESRINQMSSYLRTRAKISSSQKIDEALDQIFSYKYETLEDTLAYIKELWKMTDNYLNATLGRFSEIGAESTRNSIGSLRLITTIGVIAGILGYLGKDSLPPVTLTGGLFFVILLVVTWLVNELVSSYYSRRKYTLKKEEVKEGLLP